MLGGRGDWMDSFGSKLRARVRRHFRLPPLVRPGGHGHKKRGFRYPGRARSFCGQVERNDASDVCGAMRLQASRYCS